jgi:hypothetical protein
MNLYYFRSQTEPGFRLNVFDLVFLAATVGMSMGIRHLLPTLSIYLIPPYLVGTFFLFCNVFRIGHLLEPFWYIPFTALAIYTLSHNDLELFWLLVLVLMESLKWCLIAFRIVRGPYQGIGFALVGKWRHGRPC